MWKIKRGKLNARKLNALKLTVGKLNARKLNARKCQYYETHSEARGAQTRVLDAQGYFQLDQSRGTLEAEMVQSDVSEAVPGQQWVQVPRSLSRVHQGQASFPYELHEVVNSDWLCPLAWERRFGQGRSNNKGVVPHIH